MKDFPKRDWAAAAAKADSEFAAVPTIGVQRTPAIDLQPAVNRIALVEGNTQRGQQWFPHPFPARMRHEVATCAVRELSEVGSVVLDPMVGSGVVTYAAQALGRRAIGRDVDPLAVILSRALCTNATGDQVTRMGSEILASAERRIGGGASLADLISHLPDEDRRFLAYWFPERASLQMLALSNAALSRRRSELAAIAVSLVSSLVISRGAGVSMAMDLSRSRPHRVATKKPKLPLEIWHQKTAAFARFYDKRPTTNVDADLSQGDARDLDLDDASVDTVITSPPYLNAIDYIRTSKFSLIFLGAPLDVLREIRSDAVGTEVGLPTGKLPSEFDTIVEEGVIDPRRRAMIRRYLYDLRKALLETFRVLKPGGKALYVLGPSILSRKTYDSVEVFLRIARDVGFTNSAHARRNLSSDNRSLPPPDRRKRGNCLNNRMTCEFYVVIGKPL